MAHWSREVAALNSGSRRGFPTINANVLTMSNVYGGYWWPVQVQCGLINSAGEARYGFHMLRHAAASLFIKYLGWSPKRLQAVMGHASITMTYDRYGHLFEDVEADRADMAKIEAVIRIA